MMNRFLLILASAAAGLLARQVVLAFDKQAATPAPRVLMTDWEYATPGVLPQSLSFDPGRKCLFVALKSGGLAVLDVSRPLHPPKQLAAIGIEQLGGLDVMHLTQKKDLLFLALGDFFNAKGSAAGLAVVSIAQLREPRVLSVWKSSTSATRATSNRSRGGIPGAQTQPATFGSTVWDTPIKSSSMRSGGWCISPLATANSWSSMFPIGHIQC